MSEASPMSRISRRLRSQLSESATHYALRPLRQLRNFGREYRPIFVAGAMGSGTSLVAVALGSRFECAGVAYESAREVAGDSSVCFSRTSVQFQAEGVDVDLSGSERSWVPGTPGAAGTAAWRATGSPRRTGPRGRQR